MKRYVKNGEKYGNLIVINDNPYNKIYDSEKGIILCRCDCGKELFMRRWLITSGHNKSCGCSKKKTLQNVACHRLFLDYLYRAKKTGLEFGLSRDIFIQLIISNCFYCGSKPQNNYYSFRNKHHNKNECFLYNGIDRINNNIGYIPTNVVTSCRRCNAAKMDLSQKDFFCLVENIYNKHIKPNITLSQ